MREKVLLSGEMNTSKTLSLISLAVLYPDSKVVIFDPDDGTGKTLLELGVELPNLTIIPVTSDWKQFETSYQMMKVILSENDWVCFDMVGRTWEMSQEYYGEFVFGESPIDRLMSQRKHAGNVKFGGFDGLQDWVLIKKLHNAIIDNAVVSSKFNVMCTTSVKEYLPVEKLPKGGMAGIYASEFGIKPEGEKHNIYRFDTQAFLFRKKDNTYWFRLVRDRGRPIDINLEYEFTGRSFWEVYRGMRHLP